MTFCESGNRRNIRGNKIFEFYSYRDPEPGAALELVHKDLNIYALIYIYIYNLYMHFYIFVFLNIRLLYNLLTHNFYRKPSHTISYLHACYNHFLVRIENVFNTLVPRAKDFLDPITLTFKCLHLSCLDIINTLTYTTVMTSANYRLEFHRICLQLLLLTKRFYYCPNMHEI